MSERVEVDLIVEAIAQGFDKLEGNLRAQGVATDNLAKTQNQLAKASLDAEAAADRLAKAQIGLRENTSPSKQLELQQAVANAQVALDREGQEVVELTGEMQRLKTGTADVASAQDKAKFSFTEFNSAISVGRQAIQAAAGVYDELVGSAIRWGDEIDNLTRITGTNAEESSRLAIVLGDLDIDLSRVKTAASALDEKGLTPSLATLRKLAIQYQSIDDAAARTKWGTDTLGKAYYDLAEVLSQPIERLDELTAAADRSGRVIGQDMVDQTEELAIASRQLADEWEGMKLELAQGVVPALAEFLSFSRQANSANIELTYGANLLAKEQGGAAQKTKELAGITQNDLLAAWGAAQTEMGDAVGTARDLTTALGEQRSAADLLKEAQGNLAAAIAGPVSSELDSYYEKQKNAGAAIAETRDKIAELNGKHHLTPEQRAELDELQTKLGEQKQAYDDNAKAHEESTARIVFGFLQQRVAADGWQTGELEFLAGVGKAWGIYDEKTAAVLGSVDSALATSQGNAQAFLDAIGKGIADLPDRKDIVINVTQQGSTSFGSEDFGGWTPPATPGKPASNSGNSGWGNEPAGPGGASGLDFIVPPGYPNDSFPFRAQSGERVMVIPQGQSAGGLTINAPITIYPEPGMDVKDLAREVGKEIARAARGLAHAGGAYMGQ